MAINDPSVNWLSNLKNPSINPFGYSSGSSATQGLVIPPAVDPWVSWASNLKNPSINPFGNSTTQELVTPQGLIIPSSPSPSQPQPQTTQALTKVRNLGGRLAKGAGTALGAGLLYELGNTLMKTGDYVDLWNYAVGSDDRKKYVDNQTYYSGNYPYLNKTIEEASRRKKANYDAANYLLEKKFGHPKTENDDRIRRNRVEAIVGGRDDMYETAEFKDEAEKFYKGIHESQIKKESAPIGEKPAPVKKESIPLAPNKNTPTTSVSDNKDSPKVPSEKPKPKSDTAKLEAFRIAKGKSRSKSKTGKGVTVGGEYYSPERIRELKRQAQRAQEFNRTHDMYGDYIPGSPKH